jgi:hypothetical protein
MSIPWAKNRFGIECVCHSACHTCRRRRRRARNKINTEARRHEVKNFTGRKTASFYTVLRHSSRTHLTRSRKGTKLAQRPQSAQTSFLLWFSTIAARDEPRMAGPTPGFGLAFKGTLELRTQTLGNQVALVFSIPVCPSPREARSGQMVFFSASSAVSARVPIPRALRVSVLILFRVLRLLH